MLMSTGSICRKWMAGPGLTERPLSSGDGGKLSFITSIPAIFQLLGVYYNA